MKKWGALIVALGLALVFMFWPAELTDEEQIQQLLGQVESGFEEASIKEVAATISESYSDKDGLSRNSIKGILFQQFRKRGPIELIFSPIVVAVDGDSAQASFQVATVERDATLIGLPTNADLLHVEVILQREEEGWKITSHQRSTVLPGN